MKKILLAGALFLAASGSAMAGGILTNTNQNIAFIRMMARDGAIGIDGVYSNPAGVAFLNPGFHISLNWQSAWQTRTATTTNPLFAYGVKNNGATVKEFKGDATAPFIPSVQAAYNTDRWSFQFGFSVTGGGGKCTFENGLGSFEGAVANIATKLSALGSVDESLGATGYDMESYMQGRQFYFGFTLGAAYKINEHLSVYGGLRALYGTASYKAKLSNIKVNTANGLVDFGTYLDTANSTMDAKINYVDASLTQVAAGLAQLQPMYDKYGENMPAEYLAKYKTLLANQTALNTAKASLNNAKTSVAPLEVYRNGVNLQSDQHGFGIAPIIGIDYKTGNLNLAAKYEFRTKMGMKNKSTVNEVMAIEAVNQFLDGTTVREDSPALLTVGAEYSILPSLRVDAGYHHYYDKQSVKYGNKQDLLKGGTNEYLGGVEYDLTDKLTVSGGFQITKYGLTDDYMTDMSFVVDSWSCGFGAKYKFSDKVALQAGYFQTNYDKYNTQTSAEGIQNMYTRTNKVIGVGLDFAF